MKAGIIYKATNKINGKAYIGLTTKTLDHRIKAHYRRAKNTNNHFHSALKKYNKESWVWSILYDKISPDQLLVAEVCAIYTLDTYHNGYNGTEGGEKNPVDYPEIRDKISKALKGRKFSEKRKKDMSEARSGEKHHLFGKKRSKETCKRISESNKGKIMSEESKRKLSIANTGKKHTDKTIKKMSNDRSGKKNSNYGNKYSEESRKKISEKISKSWKIICPSGDIVITKGLRAFCKDNKLSYDGMWKVASGKQKHHKGFRCERQW